MIIAPHRHRPGHEAEDLRDFLAYCRELARGRGTGVLASITLAVKHIDPLAVLLATRSENEPWYYRENPAEDVAVAAIGATADARFTGPERLAGVSAYIRNLLTHSVGAGDTTRPFGGPCAFVCAEFDPQAEAFAFIPARMVARSGGQHTAVANLLITAASEPAEEAARVLAAHARFAAFDYAAAPDLPESARPHFAADTRHGETDYARLTELTLDTIRAGHCHKVVLARAVDAPLPAGFTGADTLEHLREHHTSAHTFSFGTGNGIEWLGATPETLLRVTGGELRTEALAGTGPRARHAPADAMAEASLLSDSKIAREQATVTGDILERLRGLGLAPVAAAGPRVLRLTHARHLITPVTAVLPPDIDALRVADALHPTPAVCGTPRAEALAFLRRHEGFDRAHYAGFSGWVDTRGDAHFTVNLRCASLTADRARLYAGAGIVEGSVPADEAAETTLKLRTITEALGGR